MKKPSDAAAAQYPIRVVSRLTGIGIDTLRAWERRYGAVTPTRERDRRLYTNADVARLRLIQAAVSSGHSVGRIAKLSDEELREITAEPAAPAPPAPALRAAFDLPAFAEAVTALDSERIDLELSHLASVMPPLRLVQDVLLPALREAGDRWYRERKGVAREHALSATIRNLLGSFLRLHARGGSAARLLFTTPPGERHEIGILCAALLAASRGLRVSYLGPDLPAREAVDAVTSSHARVLVLGLTLTTGAGPRAREVRAIVRGLPAGVEVWAGGRAAGQYASALGGRGLTLRDFDEYLAQIERVGGASA